MLSAIWMLKLFKVWWILIGCQFLLFISWKKCIMKEIPIILFLCVIKY